MKVTKKIVKREIDDYIADGCKPSSQESPRFNNCFDKSSIISEIMAWIDTIEDIRTDVDLRRIVRLILQMSEEHANKYKRFKIINTDVAWAFGSLQSELAKFVRS